MIKSSLDCQAPYLTAYSVGTDFRATLSLNRLTVSEKLKQNTRSSEQFSPKHAPHCIVIIRKLGYCNLLLLRYGKGSSEKLPVQPFPEVTVFPGNELEFMVVLLAV